MKSQNNDWHARYKAMKKAIGLTNADISEATGNTTNSIKTITQPSRMADNCPGWLKFAIIVFELMQKKDNNNIHNNQPSGAIPRQWNNCITWRHLWAQYQEWSTAPPSSPVYITSASGGTRQHQRISQHQNQH